MAAINPNQPTDFTINEWKGFINQQRDLKLNNLNLVDSQIVSLAEVLKENTTVQRIDLSNNNITVIGAKAIADMLRVNKRIASHPLLATGAINIGSNPIGKEGLLEIMKALVDSGKAGYCLDLDDQIGITEEDCLALASDPAVLALGERTKAIRSALYPW